MKCSEQTSETVLWGEQRFDRFPWFKCVKTSVKIVIIQVVPPQVSQTEM